MQAKRKTTAAWMISLTLTGISSNGTAGLAQETKAFQEDESGEAALQALREELQDAIRIQREKFRGATTDEERAALKKASPYRLFERRFLEFARIYAGQTAAMEAIQWLAETANPGRVFDEGLALAEKHYVEDEGIAKLCRTLTHRRTRGIEPFLLAVASKHPSRDIQGLATLSLARYLKSLHKFALYVEENEEAWLDFERQHYSEDAMAWLSEADADKLSGRVDALCEKLNGEYGAVIDEEHRETTGEDRTLADAAKAVSFSLHAVGSVAPKAIGQGVDGAHISLTDFRGKVVVLMFSADWCGPCKAMYGQLRELMKLYADKPFMVVTVMADKRIDTVAKAVDSGEITWPAIWDAENGPISQAWYVTAYPTIYVIDRDGRIASEGLREDALDDQVTSMLGIDPDSRIKLDKRSRVWELSLREQGLNGSELPELLGGYAELRELDLCYNQLTDDSLIYLQKLKKLQTLRLEHTGITDKGLRHLEKLLSLKEIYLSPYPGAGTTRAGRLRLARVIPGLQLLFQEPPLSDEHAKRRD